MGGGYFGKLPARKDFVLGNCPKGFLKLWELFLIKGLAQSRLDLEEDWKEAYMTMPVWRFLLSPVDLAETSGPLARPIAGAFMPSVDGAGREYPLTVVAEAGEGAAEIAGGWFDHVEAVLLSALQDEATLDGFQAAVADLGVPEDGGEEQAREESLLAPLAETEGKLTARFWCRAGPMVFAFRCNGLPDAESFRWLMLPEHYSSQQAKQSSAGDIHGRYHPEDHRT
ncbi:type VI secretion system-associated protein TagF [Roseibium sediminicola]|uniref:Type VI secretion system-associated protein TagF n=1 Tax=Roseibium sediminicola TaxID=2933272 RepID=A0ABT0GRG5_9HYPH|nr:type VI secretion system-associated protein TagF [Roseibium sp. CAU 1639]MCK7612018.1 type VI secretion system-associated protein TagF [Roseibium sp. CAU 1639]